MASVVNDPNGRKHILFVDAEENRRPIRLGKMDRKSADAIARHVEHLLNARINGGTVPRETAAWLSGIGTKLRDKLAAVALVDAPKRAALGEFLDVFIVNRKATSAPNTI